MERRVPFNAHQFLNKQIPLSAFKFDMLEGETQEFSGGFFAENASPFYLLPTRELKVTQENYLARMKKWLGGVADAMAFYLIDQEDKVKRIFVSSETREYYETLDRAKESLRPILLFDYIGMDYSVMNTILEEEFGFNFSRSVAQVEKLIETLQYVEEHVERGHIKTPERIIIMEGPRILEETKQVHEALRKFMERADLESAPHYPKVAEKINSVMDMVISDLQDRIEKALRPEGAARARR